MLLHVQGANGSGKTSLLRIVAGLLAPDDGELLWHGRPATSNREAYGADMLYLGHHNAIKDEFSALENLRATCRLAGEPVDETSACQA
jgi:heme exporter protein A